MAGPWEEYKSPQESAKGPWSEYAQPTDEGEEKIEDVMHPDISFKDRAIYKNFAVDPAQGFAYMQKKYPDLEFKAGTSGDMLIKGRNEDSWKKLDPSGFDIEDISDVAYDVPAAIAEGAATAAGGIGGFFLGGGVGAIPGAMAAGGTAGAGTEALRQYIGKEAGVAEEYDPSMMGVNAAFGAVSPLLLGTGAGLKQVGKAAAKKGLSQEATEQALKAQSGLLKRGATGVTEAISPKMGSMMSGYEPEALQKMGQMVDEKLMTMDPSQIARSTVQEVGTALKTKRDAVGARYGEALKALDVEINIGEYEKPLFDLVQKYKDRMAKATAGLDEEQIMKNAEYQDYAHIRDIYESYANKGGVLKGSGIPEYLDKINDLSLVRKNANVSAKSKVDQDIVRVTKQIAGNVNKSLDKTAAGQAFSGVKKEYSDIFELEELANKYFKDPTKAQSTMQNLASPKQAVRADDVRHIGRELGVDLKDKADQMYVLSEFAKPATASKFLGGTSGTARDIGLATAGGAGGYWLGQKTDMSPFMSAVIGAGLGRRMGSPAAMKKAAQLYSKGGQVAKEVNQMGPLSPAYQAQIWQNLMQQER